MIFEKDLTIFHDDDSTFTEFSRELRDYNRDDVAITLTTGDFLYVGLFKPFTELYLELVTANTSGLSVITGEFFSKAAADFAALPFFIDESVGFSRSAFLKWNLAPGETPNTTDWEKTTINGDELFWVRFSVNVNTIAMTMRGLNILFSNDNELEKEVSTIERFLPDGDISFAPLHQRIVLDIVDAIRNRGQSKRLEDPTGSSIDRIEMITKWDFLDLTQIAQAATYLALSKIFFAASDSPEDNHQIRGLRYKQLGDSALASYWLSLDIDDDGIQDDVEAATDTRIIVQRV